MAAAILQRILVVAFSVGALAPPAAQDCRVESRAIENEIRDVTLKTAIRTALQKESQSQVMCKDVPKLTRLDAQRLAIKSLSGLDYFVELVSLNLQENEIRDVTALKGLFKLKDLHLEGNFIDDLAPLLVNVRKGPTRSGLSIDISRNCLDLTDGSNDAQDRDALTELGVTLLTGRQPRADCPAR